MNWKKTLLICTAILMVAAATVSAIYLTEPTVQRSSASKRTAMLVEVAGVEQGTFPPTIVAMGTVRAEQEIMLSPRVSGEVTAVSAGFTPGGFVEQGEVLLQIDPADYEAVMLQRESELRQRVADFELERGRQDLAKRDYQQLQESISDEYKTLVLRAPQLDTAKAAVEAAEAAVRRAQLDLDRTRIRAPFSAHVLSREVHVGSQVSPGQTLGQLVGIDSYWVEASVPVASLRWIQLPDESGTAGSPAQVRNRAAWPENTFRQGQVHGLIGQLETQTRLARVLLNIKDPLAREPDSTDMPALMLGSFVEVRIQGKPLEDVVRMNREYLRQNDTAWVNENNLLQIRKLDIVFRDENFVYVREGLAAGDQVVTTNLATVVEGAALRLAGATE